jgi:hypothetical protein
MNDIVNRINERIKYYEECVTVEESNLKRYLNDDYADPYAIDVVTRSAQNSINFKRQIASLTSLLKD